MEKYREAEIISRQNLPKLVNNMPMLDGNEENVLEISALTCGEN